MSNDETPPQLKVFVIDDDEAVRDSLKVLLEVHGIEVEDFESTGDFTSCYRRPPRGCLILDHHLPAVTGVEFLNSPAGKNLGIPVILITGRGDPAIEQRARQAGVAEYLQKPVSERVLLATVERVTDAGLNLHPSRGDHSPLPVMAGLDPAIQVDPRVKPGDDGCGKGDRRYDGIGPK